MREEVIHRYNLDQTDKLSAPFYWGDNYIKLNLLNKLPEKTKKIKKFIFNEASSSHNASTQMGEKLFEFVTEPLWIFLHFWQPMEWYAC